VQKLREQKKLSSHGRVLFPAASRSEKVSRRTYMVARYCPTVCPLDLGPDSGSAFLVTSTFCLVIDSKIV
jgi:hypothetical protein